MGKFKQVISHEAILEVSTNGILVTDNDGVVVYLNRRAKDRLKVSHSEGIDASAEDLIPQIGREIMDCLGSGKSVVGCRLTENGINAVANITPIVIKNEVAGASVSFKDMDEFEKRAEELESYKKQNKLLEAESSFRFTRLAPNCPTDANASTGLRRPAMTSVTCCWYLRSSSETFSLKADRMKDRSGCLDVPNSLNSATVATVSSLSGCRADALAPTIPTTTTSSARRFRF